MPSTEHLYLLCCCYVLLVENGGFVYIFHRALIISINFREGRMQGNATSTVLTNRSNHITVISDDIYCVRKSRNLLLGTRTPFDKHIKGTRPMHGTTLTFEDKPSFNQYKTSTNQVRNIQSS